MNQIEVTILGQSYRLACPEGGEQTLLAAVATVDSEMSAIRDAGKVKARERIAVLAALNLAFQLAERPAETPTPSAAAPSNDALPAPDGVTSDALQTLIDRIDHAIGKDGHLL